MLIDDEVFHPDLWRTAAHSPKASGTAPPQTRLLRPIHVPPDAARWLICVGGAVVQEALVKLAAWDDFSMSKSPQLVGSWAESGGG